MARLRSIWPQRGTFSARDCATRTRDLGVLTSIASHDSPSEMRFVLTVCVLLAVVACGAKGPLYLPDATSAQQQNKKPDAR